MNDSNNKKKTSKGNSAAFWERGSWHHRTKVLLENGKTKYGKKGGFKTPEEAEESYWKCLESYNNSVRNLNATIIDKEIMFKDYLCFWLENIYKQRTETSSVLVASYAIRDLIIPNIDYEVKLRFVTSEYLQDLFDRVSKITEFSGLTARSIIYIALKDAVNNGFILDNPTKNTKVYERKKPKIIILNTMQLKRFLDYAKKENWYLEILLGVFCGLRKGEILGLKFADFNLEERTITIQRQLSYKSEVEKNTWKIIDQVIVEKDPKTPNSFRKLRVPRIIIKEIEKRQKLINNYKECLGEEFIDNDFVSCQENGLPRGLGSINNYINKLCQRASLPKITCHALRHMCATILLEQGVPIEKKSGLLGHTSIHTTYEYYCEVMDDKEQILAFMNNIFNFEDVYGVQN